MRFNLRHTLRNFLIKYKSVPNWFGIPEGIIKVRKNTMRAEISRQGYNRTDVEADEFEEVRNSYC